MKKKVVIGTVIGIATGVAAAIAGAFVVERVVKEIKEEMCMQCFTSPDGDNSVMVSLGASKTVGSLTYIRVKASSESCENECKLSLLTKKMDEAFEAQWIDNTQFRLLVGNGKRKQCCDITFNGENISAIYYWTKG